MPREKIALLKTGIVALFAAPSCSPRAPGSAVIAPSPLSGATASKNVGKSRDSRSARPAAMRSSRTAAAAASSDSKWVAASPPTTHMTPPSSASAHSCACSDAKKIPSRRRPWTGTRAPAGSDAAAPTCARSARPSGRPTVTNSMRSADSRRSAGGTPRIRETFACTAIHSAPSKVPRCARASATAAEIFPAEMSSARRGRGACTPLEAVDEMSITDRNVRKNPAARDI